MDEKEIAMLAATILVGVVAGERAAGDEKTLKRSVDLAYRLISIVGERQAAIAAKPAI